MEEYNIILPESKEDMVTFLALLFDRDEIVDTRDGEDGKELYSIDIDSMDEEERTPIVELMANLLNKNEELLEDIEEAEFSYSDVGWGGEAELAFDYNSYSEDYKEDVAKQLGLKSVKDMTQEAFFAFVQPMSYESQEIFEYTKSDGVKKSHSFTVE